MNPRRSIPTMSMVIALAMVSIGQADPQESSLNTPPATPAVLEVESPKDVAPARFGIDSGKVPVVAPVLLPRSEDATVETSADLPVTATKTSSLENTPIPLGGNQAAGATGPAAAKPTSWWNGPEAKVIWLLVILIGAAMLVNRYGAKGAAGAKRLAGGGRPSGVIQVLARYPMGRGSQLMLVECGPRIILMHQQRGRSGTGISTLSEFTGRDEVANLRRRIEAGGRDADESFSKDLERSLGTYGRDGAPISIGGSGLPDSASMETVDLTRRRPRRNARGNG